MSQFCEQFCYIVWSDVQINVVYIFCIVFSVILTVLKHI